MEFGFPESIYDGEYFFPAFSVVLSIAVGFYLLVDRAFADWRPKTVSEFGRFATRILMLTGLVLPTAGCYYTSIWVVSFWGFILGISGAILNRRTASVSKKRAVIVFIVSILLFLGSSRPVVV